MGGSPRAVGRRWVHEMSGVAILSGSLHLPRIPICYTFQMIFDSKASKLVLFFIFCTDLIAAQAASVEPVHLIKQQKDETSAFPKMQSLQTAKGKCDQLDQLESTQATLTKREHKLAQSVANWRRSKRWRRSCRS